MTLWGLISHFFWLYFSTKSRRWTFKVLQFPGSLAGGVQVSVVDQKTKCWYKIMDCWDKIMACWYKIMACWYKIMGYVAVLESKAV